MFSILNYKIYNYLEFQSIRPVPDQCPKEVRSSFGFFISLQILSIFHSLISSNIIIGSFLNSIPLSLLKNSLSNAISLGPSTKRKSASDNRDF